MSPPLPDDGYLYEIGEALGGFTLRRWKRKPTETRRTEPPTVKAPPLQPTPAAAPAKTVGGREAANLRYTWYEQLIADGLYDLVGTAHMLAKCDFHVGYQFLADQMTGISAGTVRRHIDIMVERGHLVRHHGKGRQGMAAVNRYKMVLRGT
jgi:hypothetical protein